jgi:hypothetical protein
MLLIRFVQINFLYVQRYELQQQLKNMFHFNFILELEAIETLMMAISFYEQLVYRISNHYFSSKLYAFILVLILVISSYGAILFVYKLSL